jgi:AcrR family transcriptional regulator
MGPVRDRTYAARIPREEAERRIVAATLDLLRLGDFRAVSSRKIAERADVHAPSIARYFGSMNGLFAAVARELADKGLSALGTDIDEVTGESDLALRSRLVAWCLSSGADPQQFMTSRTANAGLTLLNRQEIFAPVSRRMTEAIGEIVRFSFEGFAVLGPTHEYSPEQLTDVLTLFQEIRRHLPQIEHVLGWNEESTL